MAHTYIAYIRGYPLGLEALINKYPFRAESKILDSMPNSRLFFRRSVGCPLLVSKYVLLDTISVDIIAQIRRKQLSRYLLYLVFRG